LETIPGHRALRCDRPTSPASNFAARFILYACCSRLVTGHSRNPDRFSMLRDPPSGRALWGSDSLPSLRDRVRSPTAHWCGSRTATVTPGPRSIARRSCRIANGFADGSVLVLARSGPHTTWGDQYGKDWSEQWPLNGACVRFPLSPGGGISLPLPVPPLIREGAAEGGREGAGPGPPGTPGKRPPAVYLESTRPSTSPASRSGSPWQRTRPEAGRGERGQGEEKGVRVRRKGSGRGERGQGEEKGVKEKGVTRRKGSERFVNSEEKGVRTIC
jgi:hypothetical protein